MIFCSTRSQIDLKHSMLLWNIHGNLCAAPVWLCSLFLNSLLEYSTSSSDCLAFNAEWKQGLPSGTQGSSLDAGRRRLGNCREVFHDYSISSRNRIQDGCSQAARTGYHGWSNLDQQLAGLDRRKAKSGLDRFYRREVHGL